jgi:hypothetical protein
MRDASGAGLESSHKWKNDVRYCVHDRGIVIFEYID